MTVLVASTVTEEKEEEDLWVLPCKHNVPQPPWASFGWGSHRGWNRDYGSKDDK